MRRRLFFSTPVAVVPIEVSPTSRTVSYGSGSFTITVKAQGNWSLTCDSSYLSFDKTSGSGDDTVAATYSAVSAGFTASIVFELTSGEYVGEQATCTFKENAYVPVKETCYLTASISGNKVYLYADHIVTSTIYGNFKVTGKIADFPVQEITIPAGSYQGYSQGGTGDIASIDRGSISPTSDSQFNYVLQISNEL